jgi:hypothetical protein
LEIWKFDNLMNEEGTRQTDEVDADLTLDKVEFDKTKTKLKLGKVIKQTVFPCSLTRRVAGLHIELNIFKSTLEIWYASIESRSGSVPIQY